MKENYKKFPLPKGKEWFRLPERLKALEEKPAPAAFELPYKVFTALLTQSGGDSPISINYQNLLPLTIGMSYRIELNTSLENGGTDFTNVGAPNNDEYTWFIATGTTPIWGTSAGELTANEGAPVANVLENTIGDIWFTYNNTGEYFCKSNDLFITDKTAVFGGYYYASPGVNVYYNLPSMSTNEFLIITGDPNTSNGYLQNTPIEIRVYK